MAPMLSGPETEILIGFLAASVISSLCVARMRPRLFTLLALAPLWLILFAAGTIGIAVAVDVARDARDQKIFDQISRNDTEATVENRLGPPDSIEVCGKNLWWGYDGDYMGKNDGRCVKWVRYKHFLSAWAIGYSSDGEVVSKYHYVSE